MDKKDELLLLIAISGELPADWIGKAAGSESYGAVLLTIVLPRFFLFLISFLIVISYSGGLGSTSNPPDSKG